MVNTALLDDKIKKSGKSKGFLSNKLGITIQSFRRKCLNKNEFKMSEAQLLCDELGISEPTDMYAIFFADYVDKKPTRKE